MKSADFFVKFCIYQKNVVPLHSQTHAWVCAYMSRVGLHTYFKAFT